MLPCKLLGYDICKNKRKLEGGDDLGPVDVDKNDDVTDLVNEKPTQSSPLNIFDPRNWENLNTEQRDLLVEKGPKRELLGEESPKDKFSRCFSSAFYTHHFSNGETHDREWLVYSKDVDKVFCFCCKLFESLSQKCPLANEGYGDWEHLSVLLKEHERGKEHIFNMVTWKKLRIRLEKNVTVDNIDHSKIKREKEHWKSVLPRIISVVRFLAKNNLTFFGTNDSFCQNDKGNFLSKIEMIADWDPVMQGHVRRIEDNTIHCHYLGPNIQELITMLASEIKSAIVKKIKEAKFFSVILDCSVDASGEEQTSLLLRSVDVSTSPIKIEEYFVGFLNVNNNSGQGLFEELQNVLNTLDLDLDDVRGQGYDHGSYVKGRDQGVQKKILDINPRAWHTPCSCHSLNSSLWDVVNSCSEAKSFLGVIQTIYALFSHCTRCWKILEDNVNGLTFGPLSITHCESHVDSVRAIRLHAPEVREALLQLAETENDLIVRSKALCCATYGFDFEFLLCMIIWFDILSVVDTVSKYLESKDMLIDVAIDEVKRLIGFFEKYRDTGFTQATTTAQEIATEMEIDHVFNEKREIRRKRHLGENVNETALESVESFRIHYFLYIVDRVIGLLKRMFEQFQAYEDNFGFLFSSEKLKSLDDNHLKSCCGRLAVSLKHGKFRDVDANGLFVELKLLRGILPKEKMTPRDILNYINEREAFLSNAWIAYRILLAAPVTLASLESTFSKSTLLKSYLQLPMAEEKLDGRALISIENDFLEKLDYEKFIDDVATKIAARNVSQ